jgi:D-lactate dehydrogenase (cytochrome)
VRRNSRILPIGAQSSLTGGATPFGEVVVSTSRLNRIVSQDARSATVQAGVALATLEEALRALGATYPPAPTFMGAFAGGSVATNAAGAATFKYGSTRDWVERLTVVLAGGDVLDLVRGECVASAGGFVIRTGTGDLEVPLPGYRMPDVPKHSAGYFARPGMDLIDLFIGSEGTLGIVTEVTFRVLSPAPPSARALVLCGSERQGLELVAALRDASRETWRTRDPSGIDAAAIEHMDARSLQIVREDGAAARLNVRVPDGAAMALLIQLELPPGTTSDAVHADVAAALSPGAPDTALGRFCRLLDRFDLLETTELAAPEDRHRVEQLVAFREAVPAGVNQRVGAARRGIDGRIEKTAADMIVPFERFGEMMAVYRDGFGARGLDYAVWGHISDGNVHPNVIPRSYEDVERGRAAILEFGREVARLGGCPLAEHGVGRNRVKQALLRQLYGDAGLEQMRAVKRALDPEGRLAPGVIFGA